MKGQVPHDQKILIIYVFVEAPTHPTPKDTTEKNNKQGKAKHNGDWRALHSRNHTSNSQNNIYNG